MRTRISIALRNMSTAGVIVIMLTIMLLFGGLGFLFLSSLSIDQKNFYEAFNQSVTENRQRAAENADFRDLQVKDIQEDQNRTARLLPAFMKSINDTAFVADKLPDLIKNTENVTDLVLFLTENFGAESDYLQRENFQYLQANNTANNVTQVLETLNEIKDLLNASSSSRPS